jgi:hypothetical protein
VSRKARVYVFDLDELLEIQCLFRFELKGVKLVGLKGDVGVFRDRVAFDNILGVYLFAPRGDDVAYPLAARLMEQVRSGVASFNGGVDLDPAPVASNLSNMTC